ncbi:MAG: DUF2894 domain-containing protein [Burkholderiaceae bacterium]
MTGPLHSDIEDAHLDASCETSTLISSLRAAGADKFDPVRWHYLEALAKRTAAQEGSTKRLLAAKLAQALATFKEGFEQARSDAAALLDRSMRHTPHASEDLRRLFDAGDFKGLQRLTARLRAGERIASLAALVRQLEQHSSDKAPPQSDSTAVSRVELKTIRNFRSTWSKLSVDKQVAQALQQAPKNAGPINSHMLVLRSLALMRDISPDYLNRFISYADTLLCLEQGEKEKSDKKVETPKKRRPVKAANK